jgi:hypothetical protein
MMGRADRVRSDPKGDVRTPMAWQHRDQNFINNHHHNQQSDSRGDTFDSSRYFLHFCIFDFSFLFIAI